MHLLHQGTEETEIEVRGGAESGAVSGAVHVRNVRADGEVHGDGNAKFVGGGQDAGVRVGDVDYGVVEELAGGFTVAEAGAHGNFCNLVEILTRFRGHAECAGTETGFDVFGSVAGEGDFEIVDERGAVHSERGDEAAAHEIDEQRAKADFDYVAADAPENGFALLAGLMNRGEEIAEVGGGEEVGEGSEKFVQRGIGGGWLGKIAHADFALAGGKRIGLEVGEGNGAGGVDAHLGGFTVRRSTREAQV
ncbi:MAG: hypothetical protein JWO71_1752 [Candidatus Acidoferrum typicum]|nr:hypothetical protein [Candidatus Acidoferrum typicum]